MRRVGSRETRDRVDAVSGLRNARVTLVIALACALTAPAAAAAATIKVNETEESATFVPGGDTPDGYSDSIDDLSNDNGQCSLREAIEASNTDAAVDGCAAGDGPGDIVEMPAGHYHVYDTLIVLKRWRSAARTPGDPATTPIAADRDDHYAGLQPEFHRPARAVLARRALAQRSRARRRLQFNGLTLAGNSNPLCVRAGLSGAYCEESAIVQPEKSGGGPDTAPGLKLRNSIVRDFTAAIYLGGERAVIARNLFMNNQSLLDRATKVGTDVYSDATYTNLNPVVVRNVFANPRIAALQLQGVPDVGEQVFGGLIRGNLVNLQSEASFGILLLATHGQRVQDNVIRDLSPPPLRELCCIDGIHLDAVDDVESTATRSPGSRRLYG